MNSRVFKNVLEESNESEANFNLAIAILKFAEDFHLILEEPF